MGCGQKSPAAAAAVSRHQFGVSQAANNYADSSPASLPLPPPPSPQTECHFAGSASARSSERWLQRNRGAPTAASKCNTAPIIAGASNNCAQQQHQTRPPPVQAAPRPSKSIPRPTQRHNFNDSSSSALNADKQTSGGRAIEATVAVAPAPFVAYSPAARTKMMSYQRQHQQKNDILQADFSQDNQQVVTSERGTGSETSGGQLFSQAAGGDDLKVNNSSTANNNNSHRPTCNNYKQRHYQRSPAYVSLSAAVASNELEQQKAAAASAAERQIATAAAPRLPRLSTSKIPHQVGGDVSHVEQAVTDNAACANGTGGGGRHYQRRPSAPGCGKGSGDGATNNTVNNKYLTFSKDQATSHFKSLKEGLAGCAQTQPTEVKGPPAPEVTASNLIRDSEEVLSRANEVTETSATQLNPNRGESLISSGFKPVPLDRPSKQQQQASGGFGRLSCITSQISHDESQPKIDVCRRVSPVCALDSPRQQPICEAFIMTGQSMLKLSSSETSEAKPTRRGGNEEGRLLRISGDELANSHCRHQSQQQEARADQHGDAKHQTRRPATQREEQPDGRGDTLAAALGEPRAFTSSAAAAKAEGGGDVCGWPAAATAAAGAALLQGPPLCAAGPTSSAVPVAGSGGGGFGDKEESRQEDDEVEVGQHTRHFRASNKLEKHEHKMEAAITSTTTERPNSTSPSSLVWSHQQHDEPRRYCDIIADHQTAATNFASKPPLPEPKKNNMEDIKQEVEFKMLDADLTASAAAAIAQQQQLPVQDRDSAKRLAKRLYNLSGFKRSDVSHHLAKNNPFSQLVAEEYLNLFDFRSMKLDGALRKFLSKMQLNGETQERERILSQFSQRYYDCNKDKFPNADTVQTLVCALILLNTDLHGNYLNRKKKSKRSRLSLGAFIDGLNSSIAEVPTTAEAQTRPSNQLVYTFPRHLLVDLYESIKKRPLKCGEDKCDMSLFEAELDKLCAQQQFPDSRSNTLPTRRFTFGSSGSSSAAASSTLGPSLRRQLKQGGKLNGFQVDPANESSIEFKSGFLARKRVFEAQGKPTGKGRRGWRPSWALLMDLRLILRFGEKQEAPLGVSKQAQAATLDQSNKTAATAAAVTQRQISPQDAKNAIRISHSFAKRSTSYTKREFVFHLRLADQSELLLQANSELELVGWVDALNFASACLSAPALPRAVTNSKRQQQQQARQRPILPHSYTKLSYWEQLVDHEERLQRFKVELDELLNEAPNTRNANKRLKAEYIEQIAYLKLEIERYTVYVNLMRKKSNSPEAIILSKHPQIGSLTPSEEMIKSLPSFAPKELVEESSGDKRAAVDTS